MPEVSRFYGIVVRLFYDDHNPPHFHAEYGEHEALMNITRSPSSVVACQLVPSGS
jgi:hypothetical protein